MGRSAAAAVTHGVALRGAAPDRAHRRRRGVRVAWRPRGNAFLRARGATGLRMAVLAQSRTAAPRRRRAYARPHRAVAGGDAARTRPILVRAPGTPAARAARNRPASVHR